MTFSEALKENQAGEGDSRRRKFAEFKYAIYVRWHAVFWRTLHFLRLARIYSVTMCRLNLYRRFPDGRCMWCGEIHFIEGEAT